MTRVSGLPAAVPDRKDARAHRSPAAPGDLLALTTEAAVALKDAQRPEAIGALLAGASRLGASTRMAPGFARFVQDLRVGDVVVTQGEGLVRTLSLGKPWTHAAICVDVGPPPRFVEALGVTGSPANRGKVREADLWDFLAENQAREGHPVAIIRPAASQAVVAEAIRIARAGVGDPYDFTFMDDLPVNIAEARGGAYCSKLVHQVYAAADRRLRRSERSLAGPSGPRFRLRTMLAQSINMALAHSGRPFDRGFAPEHLNRHLSTANAFRRDGGIVRPADLVDFNPEKVVGTYRLLEPTLRLPER